MQGGSYGIPYSQIQQISLPAHQTMMEKINQKIAHTLGELVKLAGLKSDGQMASLSIRKSIQDLLRGLINPEQFVCNTAHVFGSYQQFLMSFLTAGINHFRNSLNQQQYIYFAKLRDYNFSEEAPILQTQPQQQQFINRAQLSPIIINTENIKHKEVNKKLNETIVLDVDENNGTNVQPAEPHRPLSSSSVRSITSPVLPRPPTSDSHQELPPPLSSSITAKDDDKFSNEEAMEIDKESPAPAVSSQKSEPPPKPKYIEPDNALINSEEILKYCNEKGKKPFKSISQDAVNSIGEFFEAEFRILFNNVVMAAKSRQTIPPSDTVPVVNDVKKQVTVYDAVCLSKDLKDSKNEDAQKIMAAKNVCKK
jgi:hypothetical protein